VAVLVFTHDSYVKRVLTIVEASVRPSVCPSHLTAISKRWITIYWLWAVTKKLVLWQYFAPLGEGISFKRERQRRVPHEKSSFFCYWLV